MSLGGRAIPQWMNGDRPSWFPEEFDWVVGCTYKGLPMQGREVRNVIGCNMAFRKDVFKKVGVFRTDIGGVNETSRGGEEADLCLNLKHKMSDALILFEPEAVIHHKVPAKRIKLKYMAQRCYNEGYYKRLVEKTCQTLALKPLSTEDSYLHYLLGEAIYERLRHFYQKGKLLQIGTILICIFYTGMGYLKAKRKMK
jgi:hypothetical protein